MIYDKVKPFNEDLAAVSINYKWGFVNNEGNPVIPLNYDSVLPFSEGLAAVYSKGKWGFINKNGKEMIPCIYDGVLPFSDGLAAVCMGGKRFELGILNTHTTYALIGDKCGFTDKTGKEIIPLKYSVVSGFAEKLAAVGYEWKWGFVNKAGQDVIQFAYDSFLPFSEGLAAVRSNDIWKFINKDGKQVIILNNFKFRRVGQFYNDRAYILRNDAPKESIEEIFYRSLFSYSHYPNKFGFINKEGKVVIPLKYSYASDFDENGLAFVREKVYHSIEDMPYDGGYIDKNGTQYWED